MKLRVAGAQIAVIGDIELNVEAISGAIEYAIENAADILLTPEGSLSGYTPVFDNAVVDRALSQVVSKASAGHLGLALGMCHKEGHSTFNELRFYDPHGAFLGFHSKILKTTDEYSHYASTPLRTFAFNGITIGGLICNDMWANPECTLEPDPHLTQQLATMGARIIFHAVNGGRSADAFMDTIRQYHEANLRMRARAGKLWIVTVDNCFPFGLSCAAPGGVIKPDGTWAIKAPMQDEQLFVHDIELV